MFHTEDENVRKLLFKGNFGLEKEMLRITPEGRLSHTLHPFSDKHIVRDFCENQTEINTSVYRTAEEAAEALYSHTKDIQKVLSSLEEPELLWPFSNPVYIHNEEDVPVAQFHGEQAEKTRYREYLSDRYGRYKMTLSGIHVNYSFADELLQADFKASGMNDFRKYRDQLYVVLAEQAAAYAWIVTAVTAASPLMDASYVEKGVHGRTAFNGMSSTRCSELGYWNYFTPTFDYADLEKYTDSIQSYVDSGLLAAPSELYFPVRLKPRGINNLNRLREEGVDHIELRNVDLNPLELSGINVKDLKFVQYLLVWLAGKERQPFELRDQVQAVQNFKNAAHYDLKTVKIVVPNGEVYSVAGAALNVIQFMRDFYGSFEEYESVIKPVLDFEEEKFVNPECRYAWKIRQEYADHFLEKGLELAKYHQQEILK